MESEHSSSDVTRVNLHHSYKKKKDQNIEERILNTSTRFNNVRLIPVYCYRSACIQTFNDLARSPFQLSIRQIKAPQYKPCLDMPWWFMCSLGSANYEAWSFSH
jgi:hypothetical protein